MIGEGTMKESWLPIVLLSLFFAGCSAVPKQVPAGVPDTAKWAGGIDGGVWVVCKDTEKNYEFSCSVFGENGTLWREANYRLSGSAAKSNRVTTTDLANIGYSWYDGHQIQLVDGSKLVRVY